jgi:predicted transcriptional regulator
MNKRNLTELSKKHGTIAHLCNVTDQWKKEGLIKKEKKGREIEINLTEKGKELFELLDKINNFAQDQIKQIKEKEV